MELWNERLAFIVAGQGRPGDSKRHYWLPSGPRDGLGLPEEVQNVPAVQIDQAVNRDENANVQLLDG